MLFLFSLALDRTASVQRTVAPGSSETAHAPDRAASVQRTAEQAHGEVDIMKGTLVETREEALGEVDIEEETHEHDLAGGGLLLFAMGRETEENEAPHREEKYTFTLGAAQCKESQACDRLLVHVALACTQLLALGG